jgi:hypothetical protein
MAGGVFVQTLSTEEIIYRERSKLFFIISPTGSLVIFGILCLFLSARLEKVMSFACLFAISLLVGMFLGNYLPRKKSFFRWFIRRKIERLESRGKKKIANEKNGVKQFRLSSQISQEIRELKKVLEEI